MIYTQNRWLLKKTLATLLLGFSLIYAQDSLKTFPSKPTTSHVYDENGLISTQDIKLFDEISDSLLKKTNTSLSLAIINDIGDQDIASYTADLASEWYGNNAPKGVLISVAYKQRKRSVFLGSSVNYLSESFVEKIQRKTIIPSFKQEKYGEGILSFSYEISDTIAKHNNAELSLDKNKFVPESEGNAARMVLFSLFVFFLLVVIRASGGRKGNLVGIFRGRSKKENTNTEPLRGQGFGGGFGGVNRGGSFGGGFGGSSFGNNYSKDRW